MNIHRDPRGGRNFEYYSEDPLLSGHMAAAMINGVQSEGVGATPKHYAANNQETSRFALDTIVSERALREIYLRGFEIAVKESRPWAIMSAYNLINGTYASQHKALLATVLRDEWGFDGVVMTDWFAGMDNTPAQMRAGNELLMPGTPQGTEQLRKALAAGELDEATLDRNLRYLLGVVLKSPTSQGYNYSNKPDLVAHAQIARAAAAEGIVLLKNDDKTLPLGADIRRIAAFGNTSYDFISSGTGSGDVNEAYTVSLVEGLEGQGYQIDAALKATYTDYIKEEKAKVPPKKAFWEPDQLPSEMPLSSELIAQQAASAQLALITLGRTSGEFFDRSLEGDFYLTAAEQALIADVSQAFKAAGKRTILILNIGNVVESASWRDQPDAIVLPWQGGQEAGNALMDVLTGAVNPSGKLPMTFPADYQDVPAVDNFPGIATADEPIKFAGLFEVQPMRVDYEEGVYVGYRYYDAFDVAPAYEFGYGLSYTDFSYDKLSMSSNSFVDEMKVSITITNTGDVSGKEVVQLYLAAPPGGLDKPRR
ncbi:MAG: glycoside hydrolase family 3 protein, partial [Pseudomonadales bacterium]